MATGIPISLMPLITTLSPTDKIPVSIGSNAGDNRAIEWSALQALIAAMSGEIAQHTQNTNYNNNNIAPDVITAMNFVLTEGRWLVDFSSWANSTGLNPMDLNYYLVRNSNPLLTGYDASDVTITGSEREVLGSGTMYTKGVVVTVPAGQSWIIKVTVLEPNGYGYSIHVRTLTAQKVI